MRRLVIFIFVIVSAFFYGCTSIEDKENSSLSAVPSVSPEILLMPTEDALDPSSIVYIGAFRLSEDGEQENQMFSYGGEAMAYCEEHDSLFVTGHNWYTYVAEISIPEPVIAQSVEQLSYAEIIQPLTDIRNSLFDRWELEIPRVGLEVLGGELFFCWGAHYQEDQQL